MLLRRLPDHPNDREIVMIVDQLANVDSSFYAGLFRSHGGSFKLGERLTQALNFLQQTDLLALPSGRIDLDASRVFALVQRYDTKPKSAGLWEAHRRHFDIQYVAQGEELMGYANLAQLQAGTYIEDKDFLPLQGEGSFVLMLAGMFIILGPQDAHMPQIAVSDPSPVVKVVCKVAVADD
jgi:YhcH/YjgK/YiaL family protein